MKSQTKARLRKAGWGGRNIYKIILILFRLLPLPGSSGRGEGDLYGRKRGRNGPLKIVIAFYIVY